MLHEMSLLQKGNMLLLLLKSNSIIPITGSALACTVVRHMHKINSKMENSTPVKSQPR